MGQLIALFINLFRFHKLKMATVLGFAVLFFVLLFPPEDLSDIASARLSAMTGMYLQFDKMSVNLVPSPGVSTEGVVIDPGYLPPLKSQTFDFGVSVVSALTGKLGGSASATGLFGGNVNVNFGEGEKTPAGPRLKTVDVRTESLNLDSLSSYLQKGNLAPVSLQGTLNMVGQLVVDQMFVQQPKGQFGVDIAQFSLPGQTLPTQMGPFPMPAVKLGKLSLKANMGDGNVDIKELTFGGGGGDLSGKINGQLGLALRPGGGGIQPYLGKYDLAVDMTISKAFLEANEKSGLGLMLEMIKPFKQDLPTGTRYVFRMQPDVSGAPRFSAQ